MFGRWRRRKVWDEVMKGNGPMEWVKRMEMIRGRVEEVVREEIIG